jgi:hypothetical protein
LRKAIIDRNGCIYRDKQESLDHIDYLQKTETRIHGVEVVMLSKMKAETSMYKTTWYTSQDDVYDKARDFIREQMVGLWNYAEFK